MDLTNAKLGETYKVFVNDSNEMIDKPSSKTITGTIIAKKKSNFGSGFIIGWKAVQPHPINVNARGNTSLKNDYVADQALYTYGRSVATSCAVASKVTGGLDGMACKRCTHFYTYAVPNQIDGTLLCWSCRNTW